MKMVNRREFIKGCIFFTTAFILIKNPFKLLAAKRGKDWIMPEQGRISFITGEVLINDEKADIGDIVREGDTVRTGDDSEADVEIRDYTIFHIKENSTVIVRNIFEKPRIDVKKGWFLIIVRRGIPAELRTPTVLAGIRGTVFFFNVLSKNDIYVCDCNGKVDLVDIETHRLIQRIVTSYHKAFNVTREGAQIKINKTGLKYHHDSDILKIAERFPRETMVFRNRQKEGGPSGY
jgi:hypothetical protein